MEQHPGLQRGQGFRVVPLEAPMHEVLRDKLVCLRQSVWRLWGTFQRSVFFELVAQKQKERRRLLTQEPPVSHHRTRGPITPLTITGGHAKPHDCGHLVFLSRVMAFRDVHSTRSEGRGNPGPLSKFDLTMVDSSDNELLARRIGKVGAHFGGARSTNRAAQPQATGGIGFNPCQKVARNWIPSPLRVRINRRRFVAQRDCC